MGGGGGGGGGTKGLGTRLGMDYSYAVMIAWILHTTQTNKVALLQCATNPLQNSDH